MEKITRKDYETLCELQIIGEGRYGKNPTTYFSNLLARAREILAVHISDDAEPVENSRR